MEIQIGAGANYKIGSDYYAEEVIAVEYYKTGKRAGQVKAVVTRRPKVNWDYGQDFGVYDQSAFTPNPDGAISRFTMRNDGMLRPEGSDYGRLSIGRYEEYRDPSF